MSNEVKRFSPEYCEAGGVGWAEMQEDAEGAWCKASDYDALAAEFKELAERYAKLQTGEDGLVSRVVAERDAALAELEAARKQEPAAWVAKGNITELKRAKEPTWVPAWNKDRHGRVALYTSPPAAQDVSVRRELLRRVCWPVVSGSDRHTHSEAVAELRALLATPSMEVNHGD